MNAAAATQGSMRKSLADRAYDLMENAQTDPTMPPIPIDIVNDIVSAKRLADDGKPLPEDLHRRVAYDIGLLSYDAAQFRRIGNFFTWVLILTIALIFVIQFYFHMLKETVDGVKRSTELVRTATQQLCTAQRANPTEPSRHEEANAARESATLRLTSYNRLLGTLVLSLPFAGGAPPAAGATATSREATTPCQALPSLLTDRTFLSQPWDPGRMVGPPAGDIPRSPIPGEQAPPPTGDAGKPTPGTDGDRASPQATDSGRMPQNGVSPQQTVADRGPAIIERLPPLRPAQQPNPSTPENARGPQAGFIDTGAAPYLMAIVIGEVVTEFLAGYILPGLYGLLGACAYVLRTLSFWRRQSVGSMRSLSFRIYYLYVPIGFVAGLAIGWVLPVGTGGPVIGLSPLALAFLAGYGNEVMFSTLDRIVQAAIGALGGKSDQRDAATPSVGADKPTAKADEPRIEVAGAAVPAAARG